MKLEAPAPRLGERPAWDPRFDAGHPAFVPLAGALAPFRACDDWPTLAQWNAALPPDALPVASGAPLAFVPQPRGPGRRARRAVDLAAIYDERIYSQGEVPSRARDWHDLLNMLVWVAFPRAKRALNARQRAALRARVDPSAPHLPGARSREQDALAMLDEGGLLVLCARDREPDVLAAIARDDARAWAALRADGAARALVFGHALYEHLVRGAGTVRAMAVVLARPDPLPADVAACVARADDALAERLSEPGSFARPGAHPGVPLVRAWFA